MIWPVTNGGDARSIQKTIMKKILLCIFLLIGIASYGQWPWERIEGNGHLVKLSRPVSGYSAVSSSGSWDVMIAYGTANEIQLEGDENLLPYIETTVENGKLSIRSPKAGSLHSRNKLTIYITLTRMTAVQLSGSGNIIGKGKFENAGTTAFKVSGSGGINISFNKVSAVELGISGSGNIRLAGVAAAVNATVSGSGNADCADLVSEDAKARISGSGNIKLNTSHSLDASISGSGNIINRGAATDIRKHVSGSGKVVGEG